mgnify:CR=1 FL=1
MKEVQKRVSSQSKTISASKISYDDEFFSLVLLEVDRFSVVSGSICCECPAVNEAVEVDRSWR